MIREKVSGERETERKRRGNTFQRERGGGGREGKEIRREWTAWERKKERVWKIWEGQSREERKEGKKEKYRRQGTDVNGKWIKGRERRVRGGCFFFLSFSLGRMSIERKV